MTSIDFIHDNMILILSIELEFSLLDWHVIDVEVTGPTHEGGRTFSTKTTRKNPADPGAVTGTATFASFFSSVLSAARRMSYNSETGFVLCWFVWIVWISREPLIYAFIIPWIDYFICWLEHSSYQFFWEPLEFFGILDLLGNFVCDMLNRCYLWESFVTIIINFFRCFGYSSIEIY